MGQMRVRRTGPWVKISCPFSWVQFSSRWGQRLGQKKRQSNLLGAKCGKSLISQEIRTFWCGDRTRTCDLRVMRQSQGQIGVISAPICAFYRHSFGEFSIVSTQPCPLFSDSGSKLGQYGILMFFGKPSIFVAVSSDASVNNPSSVSSGNKRNDYDETGHDHK